MMKESKRWNSRFKVIFWGIIYSIPVIIYLSVIFAYILANKGTGTFAVSPLIVQLTDINNYFFDMFPSWLKNCFSTIFSSFGIGNTIARNLFYIPLAWLVILHLVHVFIDVLLWLPHFCHNLLDRWC